MIREDRKDFIRTDAFRVVAIVKASYDLGENFVASLSYSHEADFLHLRFSNPGIGTQVNWVHLGIRKTF